MMNVRLQIGVKAESLLQKQNGTDPDRADGSIQGEEQPQKSYFSPPHTYTTCYGLPYQDHNYVAPPPPTPPASPPPPPAPKINGHIDIEDVSSNTEVTTTVVPPEETIYTPDDSITRCVCEFEHDDGYMICCDKCSVWQHVDCMGVDRDNIPDKYLCEKCEPREVDKKRAKELQIKKREELAAILYAIDSSATETGDETIGITPERERTKKSKGKKKKEREKATKANQKKNKKLKKDKKQKDKISTPSQKIKKKSRALSSNQQVNKQPITTPEPAPEKKVPTPQTTPPAVVPTSPVGTEVTPPAAPGKRASRRGSLKSPKSPAKTANKSPIAKALTPKSPAKSPVAKSPVKSPLRSPVKSPAKSPVKSPAKLPSTLNLSEDALDPWDNRLPDGYEEAKNNQYTPDIERLLSTKKLNGLHADSGESKPCTRLLDQLCKVAQVHASCKGLETTEDVEADRVMIEYIGKVMLREQYDKDNIFFRRLQPFVLFYSDFENLDLCVNAESYGNDARYVRRSCTPNARVQHVVENGKVLFFIYSQKDISKGAEVTIPFDFDYHESNYDVQCACSRPTCPVSKRHKKEEKTGKKKRSSRLSQREKKTSISVDPAEESNSNVSVGNSKPATAASVVTSTSTTSPTTSPTATGPSNSTAGPPPKRRRITPLNMNAANKHHESTSETMTRRRSATLREEEKIAEEAKTAPPTPMSPGPTSACLLSDGEEDPAAAEKRRKMTREERKMEAIMKAFEKLEKREERRKEALARLEHAKKTDKNDKDVQEGKDSVPDQLEKKEDSKPEAIAPPPAEQKPKAKVKKKGKHGMPSRRCSRVNSNASGNSSSAEPPSSTDEGSNQVAPPTPASAPPGGCDTSTNSVSSTPLTPGSAQQGKAFRFPKTKKHLMNEWLSEKAQDLQKPLTIKTEPLEVNTADGGDKNTEFIKCVPSPHATPLSHLRRSSFSGTYTPKSFNSPAPSQLDCNLGSAKKRWLRQAMFESTSSQPGTQQSPSGSMSPIPNGGMSPNPNSCTNSPGASPQVGHSVADFVTPLKKRRLARESISMDTPPYPPTPSTPTPTGSELPLSEGDKHEAMDNVRVKVEDGGTRLMNGFKPHLSPITPATPAERLFDINHLHEDRRMLYSEKQESMESSVSELLLAPSCSSLTRERHESGRSDCRSDYRSEIDTDTEDSRMEEVFRQNNGGDGLSVPHGFEMLHKLALKAEQQRQEGISLRMSSARSEGDVFEEPTKSEPDYKIELKPDLKPLPSSTASFHPSLVGLGPGAEDERMERENSMERTESMDRTESMEKESDSFSEDNVVCQAAQPEEKQLQVESSSSPLSALTRSSTVSRAESKSHNDSGLNVGAGSSHDGAASFFPSSEQCEHVTDSGGPTDLGHRDNVTSPESKLLRPHLAGDHPNVDNSERSHCNSEPSVQEAPSAAAALLPAPQRDVHIDEVASSSESARGSRDCTGSCDGSSEAMVSGSAPDNCAEPTVTSHLEARAPHLSVLPSQSDALVASGSKDEVEGMPSLNQARHLESPDQGQVSSDGDPAVVQNVEEGEVTSQAGEDVVAICEGDGDEQASSESSTGEHSVGSSNKDIGSSDKRRDSLVEMQVSCSSDPPVPGPAEQPEPGTSSSVSASHSMMDEEYELEEGECVSDSEEVTSMDVSDHSAVGHAPSEVSSSRAEARQEQEEDMEVDLPDQSSTDRGHSSEPCSSARPSQASGSLPDMASTTSCSEGEGTLHQEPHSATRSPAFLRTQSDVAEETIDSTSGSIGPSPGEPAPSGSGPSEGIGVTGDVSSSSTPLHPSLGCGAVRERTNSSSKDEEPSPSTSSPRSQVVRSLRTRSLSADHEAHSLTLRTQGGSLPCSSNTERPSEGVSTASDSNQSVSAAGNCSISSSTSVSLPSAGISTSSSPSSSSVVALSSTSPTGTAAAAAAPSSSGGLCSIPVLLPPTRKRVSLLEYRKRMKQKGRDGAPSSSLFSLSYSSSSSSSTSSSTSSSPLPSPGSSSTPRPAARDPRGYSMSPKDLNIETPPTLATLPLFDKYSNPADRQLHKGGPNSTSREDEDPETRWNTAATSVERVREQTLSLTERLRREFGVEATESDAEEDERTKVGEGGQLMYGGSQGMGHLPPPPPPPHHGGPAAGRNVQPPPPPPPPAPHPAMMGAPPLGMAPTSHGQPGPPPHQQAQQAPQQQAPQPAPSNMRNLMAIPSYTTKHFNKRSGGPAGGSSNPGGPGYPYQHGPHGGPPPLGQTYPPPSSTSQFNNLPPQSAPPYPRAGGGPGYGPHNHHPPGPAHPHQHPHQHPPPPPPPPPPAAQGTSSTAPYNSAPYSAPHAQYSTAGPPPPPPPPPRPFAPSYGQQPPPGNIKILRDYQHPKQH